jgi:hypothetical protein
MTAMKILFLVLKNKKKYLGSSNVYIREVHAYYIGQFSYANERSIGGSESEKFRCTNRAVQKT